MLNPEEDDDHFAAPASGLRHLTLASHDVDEQAQLLPRWEQAYVQLEAGRFESRIDGVLLSDTLGLFRKATNRKLHKTFSTPNDTYAVALLTGASDSITFQGCDAGRGDALLLPPGHTYDIVSRDVSTCWLRRYPRHVCGRYGVSRPSASARCDQES